jgi:quercetin dioxygenase-like cupin family protein
MIVYYYSYDLSLVESKMLKLITGFVLISVCACAKGDVHDATQNTHHLIHHQTSQHKALPPGSNMMLRAPITISEGLEVIISDVIIPPNTSVPRHFHPGEEFVYVIEGYAVHVEEGKPDRMLKQGDAYVIPPKAVHSPRSGPEGARAIVFRVHLEGKPERVLVEE